MKTLQEILQTQGLDDEAIGKVTEEMTANKIYLAKDENLDVRYGKLKDEVKSLKDEKTQADELIEELKKSNQGNEDLQGKIASYETQIQELQATNDKIKLDSQIRLELLESGVKDVDYITFRLSAENKDLKLDENGHVLGGDAIISELKTKYPTQFKDVDTKKIDPNALPTSEPKSNTVTVDQFNKMNYAKRVELYKQDEELYNSLVAESKGEATKTTQTNTEEK